MKPKLILFLAAFMLISPTWTPAAASQADNIILPFDFSGFFDDSPYLDANPNLIKTAQFAQAEKSALPTAAQRFDITPPQIKAKSYILIDAETGDIITEKNADVRLPPASMVKIMTSYLVFAALERGDLSLTDTFQISRRAWARNVVGSKMFLRVDNQVRVEELLLGLVVQSGNDAAIALAEGLFGSEENMTAEMNALAKEWGLQNTSFANVTGLPSKKNYSSARDIAYISYRLITDFPQYYSLYKRREYTYNAIRQQNRNGLLGKFAGADGIKTGYTRAAGYCLSASALRDGRRLIAVVMQTKSARQRQSEAAKLLDFGFDEFTNYRLFDEQRVHELPIYQGEQDFVSAQPNAIGVVIAPPGQKLNSYFEIDAKPQAPFAAGAPLGTIHITLNDKPYKQVAVVAKSAVGGLDWRGKILDYIKWEYLGHGHEDSMLSEW